MVVGALLSGVLAGLMATAAAFAAGHAPASAALAYFLAGMFGSGLFVAMAVLRSPGAYLAGDVDC